MSSTTTVHGCQFFDQGQITLSKLFVFSWDTKIISDVMYSSRKSVSDLFKIRNMISHECCLRTTAVFNSMQHVWSNHWVVFSFEFSCTEKISTGLDCDFFYDSNLSFFFRLFSRDELNRWWLFSFATFNCSLWHISNLTLGPPGTSKRLNGW